MTEPTEQVAARRGVAAEVIRLSIAAENAAEEINKYPGGVVAREQWDQTGHRGVPALAVVRGNVVTDAGIPSAEVINRFKQELGR